MSERRVKRLDIKSFVHCSAFLAGLREGLEFVGCPGGGYRLCTVSHREGCGAACWQVSAWQAGRLCVRVMYVG